MKTHLNTLYVTTQGSYVAKQGETVQVRVERKVRAQFPLHNLEGHRLLRPRRLLSRAARRCADKGVAVSLFTEYGRFLASVRGFSHGNVLVRRQQYRLADEPGTALEVARRIVLAKVANSRSVLLRAARDADGAAERVAILERSCIAARRFGSRTSRGRHARCRSRAGGRGRHSLFQRLRLTAERLDSAGSLSIHRSQPQAARSTRSMR